MSLLLAILLAASPTGQTLHGDAIEAQIGETLAARLDVSRAATRFAFTRAVADQTLPAGKSEIVVGSVAGRWPRSQFAVPVQLLVDGKHVRSLSVWMTAQDLRTSLRYIDDHRAGTSATDLRADSGVVDIACCPGEPVNALNVSENVRFARSVRAGDPVMGSDFQPKPTVIARESVRIEAGHGLIRLAVPGVALVDGNVGERISVRTQSGARLAARVIAKGEVAVDD